MRGQLGRVLFSGDDVEKTVGTLSGGEAARLVFCRIMVEKPNVLVLDEPTNHLDLEAIEALVEALKAFEGTLLFVSHDRWFVSALATRILEVTPTGFRDFPGHLRGVPRALRRRSPRRRRGGPQGEDRKVARRQSGRPGRPGAAFRTRALVGGAKAPTQPAKELPARRDKVLQSIEAAEARRAEIARLYAEEGFFERTSRTALAELAEEDAGLGTQIETLMAEWESLEAEISAGGGPRTRVSYDLSSRSKLTPRALPHFKGAPSSTASRAWCVAADCLPRKELYESWEVARRLRRRFRGGRVVDLACGHGLLAQMLLLLDDTSPEAIAVDRRLPESAAKLAAAR